MSDPITTQAPQFTPSVQPAVDGAGGGKGFQPFGDDGFTFSDLLDVINPLQHIPVVSSLYRNLTGDALGPLPHIAGGALFGGPIGAAASLVNVIISEATGKDMGEHVLALFSDPSGEDNETKIAANEEISGAELEALRAEAENAAPPAIEYAEVLQWAQDTAPLTPPLDSIRAEQAPVITGAELELLRAEADALTADGQAAQLPADPSLPPMPTTQELADVDVSFLLSDHLDVQQWALHETKTRTSAPPTAGAAAQYARITP